MSERTVRAAVGVAAVALALTATAVARADGGESPVPQDVPDRLTVTSLADVRTVQPGGAVTGSLEVTTQERPSA